VDSNQAKQSSGERKFKLGRTVMTCTIQDRILIDPGFEVFVFDSLMRHSRCDWGEMDDEDLRANFQSINERDDEGHLPGRLFSAYDYKDDASARIWIITEWDESVTTVLFPGDY